MSTNLETLFNERKKYAIEESCKHEDGLDSNKVVEANLGSGGHFISKMSRNLP